MEQLH